MLGVLPVKALRRLLCAVLGHVQPEVAPQSWWRSLGSLVGPCQRCGERRVWRLS